MQVRAEGICSNNELLQRELGNIIKIFEGNGYRSSFVKKALASKTREKNVEQAVVKVNVTIPYLRGISERIKRIAARYGLRVAIYSRNTIGKFICYSSQGVPKLDSKNVIYSITRECGAQYIGETSRPLGVRIGEHMKNVKLGKTNTSRLAEHAWAEHHKIKWDDVAILGGEKKMTHRKIKEGFS